LIFICDFLDVTSIIKELIIFLKNSYFLVNNAVNKLYLTIYLFLEENLCFYLKKKIDIKIFSSDEKNRSAGSIFSES